MYQEIYLIHSTFLKKQPPFFCPQAKLSPYEMQTLHYIAFSS